MQQVKQRLEVCWGTQVHSQRRKTGSCSTAYTSLNALFSYEVGYPRVIPVEGSAGVAAFAFLVLGCAQRQTEGLEAASRRWHFKNISS